MSGTSSSLNRRAQSLMLPVPAISLAYLDDTAGRPINPSAVNYTVSTDGTKVFMDRAPMLTAMELSADLFAQDLRLELLWYRRTTHRPSGVQRSGYHHPSHFLVGDPALDSPTGAAPFSPMLPNSRFRGGRRSIPSGAIGLRSEWSVMSNTQRFFIDTLGDFLFKTRIGYRDVTNNSNAVDGFVSTNYRASSAGSVGGGYFGYNRAARPNYFQFRYSIKDPRDARSRITGPMSQIIKFAPAVHPFYRDDASSQQFGVACNRVNPMYMPDRFNCWFETSLPSNG